MRTHLTLANKLTKRHAKVSEVGNYPSKQIVLVEDDEDLLHFLKGYLQRTNYEVFAFSNGKDACEFLTTLERRPDLAIFDYTLPDMTGLQVAQCLSKWLPRIPLVFLSAEMDLSSKLRTSPFAIVLRKPVELFDLRIVIDSLLANAPAPTHQTFQS